MNVISYINGDARLIRPSRLLGPPDGALVSLQRPLADPTGPVTRKNSVISPISLQDGRNADVPDGRHTRWVA